MEKISRRLEIVFKTHSFEVNSVLTTQKAMLAENARMPSLRINPDKARKLIMSNEYKLDYNSAVFSSVTSQKPR